MARWFNASCLTLVIFTWTSSDVITSCAVGSLDYGGLEMNNSNCNCDNCVAVESQRGVILWRVLHGNVAACRQWEQLLTSKPCNKESTADV